MLGLILTPPLGGGDSTFTNREVVDVVDRMLEEEWEDELADI